MAKYINVSNGLRGCYMPDNTEVVKVSTRKEMKKAVEAIADHLKDAGCVGLSNKAIASYCASVWREINKPKPTFYGMPLPYKYREDSDYHNAIFISVSTRADYLSYVESEYDL